jgi:hypothetical protein
MKLKYRGISYEYKPIIVAVIEGEVAGKYRGVAWKQMIPQIAPIPEPHSNLKYRGVAYSKGAIRLTHARAEEAVAPRVHPEMLSEEQPLLQPK